jgi:hypothetical protein
MVYHNITTLFSLQVEYWVEDSMYVFGRGDVMVVLTNIGGQGGYSKTITNHPYREGQTLCNM